MVIACGLCGKDVHAEGIDTFSEQTGWAVNRVQGGTNQLSLRKQTGRYAHGSCVRLAIRGVDPEYQESML